MTIITEDGIDDLYAKTKIKDAPYLKGKHGELILLGWKKPDNNTPLETLLDFRKFVNVEEIKEQLYLTDLVTSQLQVESSGRDSGPLEDK